MAMPASCDATEIVMLNDQLAVMTWMQRSSGGCVSLARLTCKMVPPSSLLYLYDLSQFRGQVASNSVLSHQASSEFQAL
eukprot:4355303-Amphidinium_carterae.2